MPPDEKGGGGNGAGASLSPPRSMVQMRGGRLVPSSEHTAGIPKHTAGMVSTPPSCGATLVVCPTSLLAQWEEQLQLHVVKKLAVAVYYGNERQRSATALSSFDVVLTTYGVLGSEFSSSDADFSVAAPFAMRWRRVVLDEAHYIKGRTTQTARATFALDAECRWVVTGRVTSSALHSHHRQAELPHQHLIHTIA